MIHFSDNEGNTYENDDSEIYLPPIDSDNDYEHERASSFLSDLEGAIEDEDIRRVRKLLSSDDQAFFNHNESRLISKSSILQHNTKDLQNCMLETDNPDLFELFQGHSILNLNDSDLESLLDDAFDDQYSDLLPLILDELRPSEEYLIDQIFANQCDLHLETVLRYCLDGLCNTDPEINDLVLLFDVKNKRKSELQIVTSLFDESSRHTWEDAPCKIRRELLGLIDKRLKGWKKEELEHFYKEDLERDFYGVDLSSDSDSEDEQEYKEVIRMKKELRMYGTQFSYRDSWVEAGEALFGPRNKELELEIERLEEDLWKLNSGFGKAKEEGTIAELLSGLRTKFVVAHFRGMTYNSSWSKSGRRFHRKMNQINQPLYSSHVYRDCGVDFNSEESRQRLINDRTLERQLQDSADKTMQFLLELRKSDRIKNSGKFYETKADLIQELYTNDFKSETLKLKEFGFQGAGNPFVSMSDDPDHALRYAFGMKAYQGCFEPRWRRSGKAEQSKSGKVYLTIHPLTDYGKEGPLSPSRLVFEGRIGVSNLILAERETTFPGYIPENRVRFHFVAKYPSFHTKYKSVFKEKYGLDQETYEKIQKVILSVSHNTPEYKKVKDDLATYLCDFHKKRLLSMAQQIAKCHNAVLVYQQLNGIFLTKLNNYTPNLNGDKNERVRVETKKRQQSLQNSMK